MKTNAPWFVRARLKTRQLMLLVALDEEGNIHRAAETLNMSQPAASKLLKDLEDMLEVSLFDRLPRGMQATWYGEVMIRHARAVLAHFTEARDQIEALRAGRFGNVSVGAITGPALSLLPPAVASVKRERPSLRVQVQIETSDVLLERLSQGKLDMLVARLFERHDKTHLRYERLDNEAVCALVRPGHPLLAKGSLQLSDVAGVGWVAPPPGKVLRHRFDLMFQEAGLDAPDQLIEATEPLFITRILGESDYIAVLPTDVGRYCAEHGLAQVLPIQLACQMDAFGLITRTDRMLSPAARVMLKALRSVASGLYPSVTTLAMND